MAVNVKMGTVTAGTCRIQVRFVLSVVVMFSIAIVIMEAYYMIGSSTVDLTNVQEVITPPNDTSTDGHKQRIIEDVMGISTFIRDTTVTVDLNNVQEVITPPNDASNDGHKPRQRMILMMTKWFYGNWPDIPHNEAPLECPEYGVSCRISYRNKNYKKSDLVAFHEGDFDAKDLTKWPLTGRPPHQRWVYYNAEAPFYRPVPQEYDGLFNWTMTLRSDSDIVLAYGAIQPKREDTDVFDPNLAGRDKMAVVVISNCHEPRMDYIRELQKHITVDVFGGCGRPCRGCFDYFPRYKFYLSFENCLCKDYVTEKFYRNALMKQLVPVVINKANLSNVHVAPPGSYIDASDFKNAKELADYMTAVSSNSTLYNSFFKWHSRYRVYFPVTVKDFFCNACHRLYTSTDTNIWNNLSTWYGNGTNCVPYLSPV